MKVLDGISDGLATWLLAQPMFFVATAPLAVDGHVNLSPKPRSTDELDDTGASGLSG